MLQVVQPVKTEAQARQATADQPHIGLLVMGRHKIDPRLYQQRIGQGALAVFDHSQAVVEVVQQQPIHRRQAIDRIQLEGGQRQPGQHRRRRQRFQGGAHGRVEARVERGGLTVAQRRVGVVMQLAQLHQMPGVVDAAGGVESHRGKRRHFLQRHKLRRREQRTAVVQGHNFALELKGEALVRRRRERMPKLDRRRVPGKPRLPLRVQRQRRHRFAFAVALPDRAQGVAEMLGKTLAVTHRRVHQHRAQVAADAREAVEVAGQLHHPLTVLRPTVHHQLRQSGVDQVRGRVAPGEGRPGQGDHRHAHQQRFAGGQAAGIGPGVEGDIDAVVGLQQVLVPHRPFDHHPFAVDAMGGHDAVHMVAQGACAEGTALEQQARIGRGAHQLGPVCQQHIVDLGRIVEAAIRDKTVRQGRQRLDVRGVGRRVVADVVVGQADEFFGVEPVLTLR